MNYTLSFWSATEKMSLPSEFRKGCPKGQNSLSRAEEQKTKEVRPHMLRRKTEISRPREALMKTNCGFDKCPRSFAHSVLNPGLCRYFVWIRPTPKALTTSLKRAHALGR